MGEEKKGFFKRLVSGLTKTRDNIVSGMDSIFHGFSLICCSFTLTFKSSMMSIVALTPRSPMIRVSSSSS